MTKEELKIKLTELFPRLADGQAAGTFDESGEWLNINLAVAEFLPVMKQFRQNAELSFDYIFCLTCIDWKTHLTIVYHLESTQHRHQLVVKVQLDRNKPETESVSAVWRTAEFHEREVYEMFGVNFRNHPDLRLLILPDGWEGRNPLRKDFEDPVNMIKL
jgi:NADH:ubiquinone oxidoreductase subunit C